MFQSLACFMVKVKYLVLLALMLMASTCSAFEGYEHGTMGDLAYELAYQIHCGEGRAESARPTCVLLQSNGPYRNEIERIDGVKPVSSPNSNSRLTYGNVVQCVDAMLTPEYLFAVTLNKMANDTAGAVYPPSTGIVGNWGEIGLTGSDCIVNDVLNSAQRSEIIRATHNNHSHFGSHLVTTMQLYHYMAISFARSRDLGAALAVNALADHFLHDFFAPGHLAVNRNDTPDLLATQIHDEFNGKAGVHFFLDFGGGVNDFVGGAYRERFRRSAVTALRIMSSSSDVRVCGIRYNLAAKANRLNMESMLELAVPAGWCDSSEDRAVVDVLKDVLRQAEIGGGKIVSMMGDDRLWDGCLDVRGTIPGGCLNSLSQRIVILLAGNASILEVIAAYEQSLPPVEKFGIATAVIPRVSSYNANGGDFVYAGIGVGHYCNPYKQNVRCKESDWFRDGESKKQDSTHHGDPMLNFDSSLWKNMPVAVSLGKESMSTSGISRTSYLLATSKVWRVERSWFEKYSGATMPTVLSLGVVGHSEGSRTGLGVQLAGGVILTGTEIGMSVFTRRVKHDSPMYSMVRNGYGFRMDMGISQLVSFYLGTAKDSGLDRLYTEQRGWLFSAGLSVGLPVSRWVSYIPSVGTH